MNKLLKILTGLLLMVTCTSCKNEDAYKVGEYLCDLAYSTGICLSETEEECFESLREYGVVDAGDKERLEDRLTYGYLKKSVAAFFEDEETEKYLMDEIFTNSKRKDSDYVNKEEAAELIKLLTDELNNPNFEERSAIHEKEDVEHLDEYELTEDKLACEDELGSGDLVYLEKDNAYKEVIAKVNDTYVLKDAEAEDIYESIDIAGSYEVDFEDATITDLNEDFSDFDTSDESVSSYTNTGYELLAAKRHTFKKDDYNIAYTINSGTINFRITRKVKDGVSMFFDTSVSKIKPTYKWDDTGESLNAFFKIDFDITNEIGVSTGKYDNYYLDFKDLDSTSFKSLLKSSVSTKHDALEATIPICTINTPLPNVPTATFNIDVLAKFYVSGKVTLVLQNSGECGFEIKDGKFRVIHDVEHDDDFVIGASARAVAGLNFNLCTASVRLMDVELDGGIRAAVSTTLHLYDDEGNETSESLDEDYSAVYEIAKDNPNVAVCGDLSLNWVLEADLNTSKTVLYKFGFSRKKTLLDKKNQLFDNLTHIENFQFVKSCTRKNKTRIAQSSGGTSASADKIILSKYSLVIIKGHSASLPISSLPSGYSLEDLVYESDNTAVAAVTASGTIDAEDLGTCKISIRTKDGKYTAYLNILVSTG